MNIKHFFEVGSCVDGYSFNKQIRRNSRFRRFAYTSFSLLFLLVLFTLCPLYFIPPVTEATAKTATPSELNYSSIKDTASVSLEVSNVSGSFATSGENEKASFSLSTTNASGYTLNLRTSGSNTALENGTNTIPTISSTKTESEFSTNTWGLMPSKYNGEANTTNYYPASNAGFKIDETSSSNTTTANTYTVGLGLKAGIDIPAGTYTNSTIIAEYVANPVSYAIYYYSNTTDTVTNMPSTNPQTGTISNPANPSPSATINTTLASQPTRTGYTFKGWCLGASGSVGNYTGTQYNTNVSNITVKTDGTSDVCGGTTYDAGQAFGIDATNTNPETYFLYAMWQRNSYTCTKQYRLQNADGTWGAYQPDGTESVLYGATCNYSKTVTNYKNSANGTNGSTATTSGTMGTSGLTLSLSLYRNTFTITRRYRLQGTDANYPSSYTNASPATETVRYGASYTYSISATTTHQAKSQTISSVTSNQTISLDVPRKTFTITKRYRLQGADGNYPSSYTGDGTVSVVYGGSYTYSKTVTDYNGNAAKSVSVSNVTSTQTLSLDFPRNTYTLTVTAGTNTSSATGGGTYRWGQTVAVGVTKATNVTCTTYATPTWTQSGTTGTFSSTSGTSVNFTMGKGNATVTATSGASNVAQTITLSKGTGVTGITIAGTNRTGTSVSLNCGTYNISGNYSDGYEFSSWSRANGVTVASTTTASTTMTVSGAGTLTLNSKAKTYSLTINFTANTGVSSVKVCKTSGNCGGTNLMGTVSSSGGTVSNLAYGTAYYLYPTFESYYTVDKWAKTGGSGTLSSTAGSNPTFTMGNGNGTVTLTGKTTCTSGSIVTFKTSNATSISLFNQSGALSYGTYTNNQKTCLDSDRTYFVHGNFDDGTTMFSSWSTTAGTIRSAASRTTAFVTPSSGNMTLTLTGRTAVTTTMQNFTLANCQSLASSADYTIKDSRDNKYYTVRYINGQCWMTQNLRFTNTSVPSASSNVTANKTMIYYDLVDDGSSGGKCYEGTSSANPLGFTNACIKDSGNNAIGVWYNYAAATAGTITGYSNSTNATQDICPKNWHLPTGPNNTANTDINKLVGNTTYGWQSGTTGTTAFSAFGSGSYSNGTNYSTPRYFAASTDHGSLRDTFSVDIDENRFSGTDVADRYDGQPIRCVRSS